MPEHLGEVARGGAPVPDVVAPSLSMTFPESTMSTDDKQHPTPPLPPRADDAVEPAHASRPQSLPDDLADESMTGEEDPGSSLDSVVNPLPPASRPA